MQTQKSILVVDDDQDICRNLQDILSDLGYETDTAQDGQQALERVQARAYDVVLLDFLMPGMDGAELYREIKRLRPEAVAIMITAFAREGGVQEAMDSGTWRVLRKPVDVGQLLPLIETASSQPVVLLVDDDREFCDSMWQLLREQEYRVCLAHSEEDGLEKTDEVDFDVALVDLRLGSGDGHRIVDFILKVKPQAKVCVITGNTQDEKLEQFEARGLHVCLKPIDPACLLGVLSELGGG